MQKLAFSIVHFGREGGAPGQKFFLGWSTLVRSKTSWQTKKTSGTSPAHWGRFWPLRIEKRHFFQFFNEDFSFLEYFCRSAGGPLIPEISSSNKLSKIYLSEGRTQKLATFDTPNTRSQILARQAVLTEFKVWKCLAELGFGIEDLGGVKCCCFLGAPIR